MGGENQEIRLSEICEAFAEQLRSSGGSDYSKLISENSDLEPELSKRLQTVLLIWETARQQTADKPAVPLSIDDDTLPTRIDGQVVDGISSQQMNRGQAHRIHCPHCGIGIQVVDDGGAELTCRACGSSIQIDLNRTRTHTQISDQRIGHFRLLSILGQGSFGTVYKAKDESLGREVAIKIPREGFFPSSKDRQRFIREAQHASQLNHPGIVRVYEIDEEDDVPFIVSELIEGITLADLSGSRQLEFGESAEMVAAISEAVNEAHAKGIIHRDLKPSNVLLDRDLKPYVTDFGLARASEAEMTMTVDGEVLGTLLYMSPEQASGASNKVDKTSDVYSLGVILYRLLSGALPFRGSERMVLHQVKFEEPKTVRKLNDRIPRDLETITTKAMAKEPHKRYETAGALAADLNRWINGEAIHARPASRLEKLIRRCRRRPLITGLVASIAAMFIVALSFAIVWAISNSRLASMTIKSQIRLVRMYEQEGERHLQQDNLIRSLTWYSEALSVDPNKDPRHRFRIGTILNQCPTLSHLFAVEAAVTSITVSSNGNQIAVGDANGTITILEAKKGIRLHTLNDHQTAIKKVLFSADGQKLVSVARDDYAVLWDLSSGQRIGRLDHNKNQDEESGGEESAGQVRDAQFDNSTDLILTSAWNGTAKLWNTEDGKLVKEFSLENRSFNHSTFSTDAKQVCVSSYVYDVQTKSSDSVEYWVSVWNVESGELVHDIKQDASVTSLVANPITTELLIATSDNQINFINLDNGKRVRSPIALGTQLDHVSYSDNAKELLTVTKNGELTIWTLAAQPAKSFTQFIGRGNVKGCALSKDRRLIASTGDDGSIDLDFIHLDSNVCCPLPGEDLHTIVALNANGRQVITGSAAGAVRVWELAGTKSGQSILPHAGDVYYTAISPVGKRVATVSADGTARLWDLIDGQQIGSPMQHDSSVFRAEFNADGSLLATVSTDKTAKLWNGETAAEIESYQHESMVVRMAFHPSLDQFASGTEDGHVAIWENGKAESVGQESYPSRVMSMRYSQSGNILAIGFLDGTLMFVELNKRNPTTRKTHGDQEIYVIRQLADGSSFVTGGFDSKIRLWNIPDFNESENALDHLSNVYGLDIRVDNSIAVADGSGRLTLWQRSGSDWEKLWVKQLDAAALSSTQFHPKDRFIAIAGSANNVSAPSRGRGFAAIYDVESRTAISPRLSHFDSIHEVVIDPDGEYAVTCSKDQSAIIWNLKPTDLDVEHLRTLCVLYTSQTFDDDERLVQIDAKQLEELFRSESKNFPSSFCCTPEQIRNWENWIGQANKIAEEVQTKQP